MKKKVIAAALISVLSLPFIAFSFAQDNSTSSVSAADQRDTRQHKRHDMRGSELLGKNVRNKQGQSLGRLEDVLINVKSGRVQYAVLSFGGFLGLRDKWSAIPLSVFERGQQGDQLVLNVSKERLQQAEGFEEGNWPNYRGDTDFFTRIHRYFGTRPTQDDTRQGMRHMMRLSQMMGQDVEDRRGEYVGEVEDAVIDIGHGRVSYVLLEYDQDLAPKDKLVPLPLKALTTPKEQGGDMVLTMARERLDRRMDIERNNWPDLNDLAHQRNMDRYLGSLTGGREMAQERRPRTSGGAGAE